METKYFLKEGKDGSVHEFLTTDESIALDAARGLANSTDNDVFVLKEIATVQPSKYINEFVDSFEAALKYLRREDTGGMYFLSHNYERICSYSLRRRRL